MLEHRDIIIFGDDWGRHPSTIQHIGKVLAFTNRILWIGSLGHRKLRWNLADLRRAASKAASMASVRERQAGSENVTQLPLRILPFHDSSTIRSLNARLMRRQLMGAIRRLALMRPVLLTCTPWACDVVGGIGETSAFYICLDDYSLFTDAYAALKEAEQKLLQRVDAAFFVSEALRRKHSHAVRRSYMIGQGVDAEHFRQVPIDPSFPGEQFQKPIVGFVGLVADWIDLDLIVACARAYPAATFLVIGKTATDAARLRSVENIHIIGEISYDMLPQYMCRMDVGLVPFVVNELTVASNPLKMFEYMAAGVPVVSTNLPEVARFRPLVRVAGNAAEFVKLIGEALQDNSSARREARISMASEHSWSKITETISSVIAEIESQK